MDAFDDRVRGYDDVVAADIERSRIVDQAECPRGGRKRPEMARDQIVFSRSHLASLEGDEGARYTNSRRPSRPPPVPVASG
jgi:hypothetical protein